MTDLHVESRHRRRGFRESSRSRPPSRHRPSLRFRNAATVYITWKNNANDRRRRYHTSCGETSSDDTIVRHADWVRRALFEGTVLLNTSFRVHRLLLYIYIYVHKVCVKLTGAGRVFSVPTRSDVDLVVRDAVVVHYHHGTISDLLNNGRTVRSAFQQSSESRFPPRVGGTKPICARAINVTTSSSTRGTEKTGRREGGTRRASPFWRQTRPVVF